jgi:hypothetical protein
MRLLRSDSPEVIRALASQDCVSADSPRSEVGRALGGSMLIGLLFLCLRGAHWDYAGQLAGAVLVIWNGVQLWRATFKRRHWLLAACEGRFYIRLFNPVGSRSGQDTEANVLTLDMAEVGGIQVRTADIFIHGPKPTVYEWLVIEAKRELWASAADHFERLGQPAPGFCPVAAGNGPYGEWFAGWWNERVSVRWLGYRPTLKEYVRRIAARYPDLTIQPEAHPELDLVSIVSKREPERRRLLAQAKKMGFNNECVWALYMYTGCTLYQRTKSLKEAQEYMSTVDVGADDEVDPPEQTGAPTTESVDPHRSPAPSPAIFAPFRSVANHAGSHSGSFDRPPSTAIDIEIRSSASALEPPPDPAP